MPERTLATPRQTHSTGDSPDRSGPRDVGGLARAFAHRFDDGAHQEVEDRNSSSGWQAVPRGGGLGLPSPIQAQEGPSGLEEPTPVQADMGADGKPTQVGPEVELPSEGGAPLADELRTSVEEQLGADFSAVRVHSSTPVLDTIGALAVTRGEHIYFAPGRYAPESESGRSLLSHELTHVLQQRAGRVRPTTSVQGLPVNDDPSLEQEADQANRSGGGGTASGNVVQGKFVVELGLPAKAPVAFDQPIRGVVVKSIDPQTKQPGPPDEEEKRSITKTVSNKQLTELYGAMVTKLEWPASEIAEGKKGVHTEMKKRVEDTIARDPEQADRQSKGDGAMSAPPVDEVKVATGFIDQALTTWLEDNRPTRKRSNAIVGERPKLDVRKTTDKVEETDKVEKTTDKVEETDKVVKTRPRSNDLVGQKPPKLEDSESSEKKKTTEDSESTEDKTVEEAPTDEERIERLGSMPESRVTPTLDPGLVKRANWDTWLAYSNLPGAQLDVFGGRFLQKWNSAPKPPQPKQDKSEKPTQDPVDEAMEKAATEHVADWEALSRSGTLDAYRFALPLLNTWSRDDLVAWLVQKARKSGKATAAAPKEPTSTAPLSRSVDLQLAEEINALDPGLRATLHRLSTDDSSEVPPEKLSKLQELVEGKNPLAILESLGESTRDWTALLLEGGGTPTLRTKLQALLAEHLGPTVRTTDSRESDPTVESVQQRLEKSIRAFVATKALPDGRDQPEQSPKPREKVVTVDHQETTEPVVSELSSLDIESVDWSTWESSETVQSLQLQLLRLELKKKVDPEANLEARTLAAKELVGERMSTSRKDTIEKWLVAVPLVNGNTDEELIERVVKT